MKNTFQKLIVMLLVAVLMTGICCTALADDESISIYRAGSGDIYFGDRVTLAASVKNVEGDYTIVWEQLTAAGWVKVGTGATYTFTVNEVTAAAEYRAMLVISQ